MVQQEGRARLDREAAARAAQGEARPHAALTSPNPRPNPDPGPRPDPSPGTNHKVALLLGVRVSVDAAHEDYSLEAAIGTPDPDVFHAMEREHDCGETFDSHDVRSEKREVRSEKWRSEK